MSKTAHIAPSVSVSSSAKSDSSEFVSIALFCGIGLLISLVAVITGIQGVWF